MSIALTPAATKPASRAIRTCNLTPGVLPDQDSAAFGSQHARDGARQVQCEVNRHRPARPRGLEPHQYRNTYDPIQTPYEDARAAWINSGNHLQRVHRRRDIVRSDNPRPVIEAITAKATLP